MPGIGKSTFSKKLAREFGYDFLDVDALIESESGDSIETIFRENGEEEFRKMEQQVLLNLKEEKVVIATGGGAPCFYNNADVMLENGLCLYLYGNTNFILSRLASSKTVRPLLAAAKSEEDRSRIVEELIKKREPFYLKAHLKVDALNADVKTIAAEIGPKLV